MWLTVAIAGWALFVLWTAALLPGVFKLLCGPLTRKVAGLPEPDRWPLVSVIVPARDEGPKIEQGLRSLLQSDYPQLEVIAVDDRSTDETGAIMDRLAADDARLKVLHVQKLPDGWLGKTHALHLAASSAEGELLLFTDGDILFEPSAIRQAVIYVEHRRLDHLALFPNMVPGGFWENALVCFFSFLFIVGTQPALVPTSFKLSYVGIGAFNLVRRKAYDSVGGFEPIRLDVLDDVKLGKLLKWAGCRQDVLLAQDLVRVKWQRNAVAVIHGLEKNGFASLNYSLLTVLFATLFYLVNFCFPYAAPFLFPDARCWGFVATLVLFHSVFGLLGRQAGAGWRILPAFPIAAFGISWAFWRSAFITLRQGGVRWRETFYPLETLRKNLYR